MRFVSSATACADRSGNNDAVDSRRGSAYGGRAAVGAETDRLPLLVNEVRRDELIEGRAEHAEADNVAKRLC